MIETPLISSKIYKSVHFFKIMNDYYATLGIPRTATLEEIKKAFRHGALKSHPDRNKKDPLAEERFKQLNDAYSVLGDTDKRKVYDKYGPEGLKRGFQSSENGFDWGEYHNRYRRKSTEQGIVVRGTRETNTTDILLSKLSRCVKDKQFLDLYSIVEELLKNGDKRDKSDFYYSMSDLGYLNRNISQIAADIIFGENYNYGYSGGEEISEEVLEGRLSGSEVKELDRTAKLLNCSDWKEFTAENAIDLYLSKTLDDYLRTHNERGWAEWGESFLDNYSGWASQVRRLAAKNYDHYQTMRFNLRGILGIAPEKAESVISEYLLRSATASRGFAPYRISVNDDVLSAAASVYLLSRTALSPYISNTLKRMHPDYNHNPAASQKRWLRRLSWQELVMIEYRTLEQKRREKYSTALVKL